MIVFLIIGTVLFQGFQCASPEMTSAKLAVRNHDYAKAETKLNQELSKNPNNVEANIMMASVKMKLHKTQDVVKYLDNADKNNKDPKNVQKIAFLKYNAWADAYNTAVNKFNKYFTTKNKALLDTAIQYFDIDISIRPNNPEFYRLKGQAYESLKDDINALNTYKKYIEKISKEIQFAKNNHIFLDLPRKEVIKKLGAPNASKPDAIPGKSDTLLTDKFITNGHFVLIFYSQNTSKDYIIDGWRVDPPKTWLPMEVASRSDIHISPIAYLADYYFKKKDLDNAKKYAKMITTINPSNVQVNSFLVNIYVQQGKTNEALSELDNLCKDNPDNKFYLSQYGEILFTLKKYDKAIIEFEKALKIDPNYCDVLRNLGAAFKNKAFLIIQAQQDKSDKDKKYKGSPDEYKPLLNKSAKYFAQCRTCDKYKNDLMVLSELSSLYYVLERKDDLNSVVDDLERLEQIISDDQKESYWMKMCKILSNMKSPKAKRACNKANEYLK